MANSIGSGSRAAQSKLIDGQYLRGAIAIPVMAKDNADPKVDHIPIPEDWFAVGFDHSSWGNAVEYTEERVNPKEPAPVAVIMAGATEVYELGFSAFSGITCNGVGGRALLRGGVGSGFCIASLALGRYEAMAWARQTRAFAAIVCWSGTVHRAATQGRDAARACVPCRP